MDYDHKVKYKNMSMFKANEVIPVICELLYDKLGIEFESTKVNSFSSNFYLIAPKGNEILENPENGSKNKNVPILGLNYKESESEEEYISFYAIGHMKEEENSPCTLYLERAQSLSHYSFDVDDIVYDFINYAIEMKLEGNNISIEKIYKMYNSQIKLIHKNRNA